MGVTDEMISLDPPVMRVHLKNQSAISKVFLHYAGDTGHMSWAQFMALAKDFSIVPALCNFAQLRDIFSLVNACEAADDDVSTFDSEEFMEGLVRLAVFYNPTVGDVNNSR